MALQAGIPQQSLETLSSIYVPPRAAFANAPVIVGLHGLCDASICVYGACVYIRIVTSDDSISVLLLSETSTVVPLKGLNRQKKVILPQLELSAAVISRHLYNKVNSKTSLNSRPFSRPDSTAAFHRNSFHYFP